MKTKKKCAFEVSELFKNLTVLFGNKAEILKDEKPRKIKQKFISIIIIKFPPSLTQKF